MSKCCEKCGCYLPVGGEECPACGYSKKTEIKHDKFLEANYKEINRMKNTNVFNNTSNSFVWKPEDYVNVANKPEVIKARIESQIMDVNENLKEKLVGLLEPHMSGLACEYESGSCELTSCRSCNARNFADHLIANGVTVQECGYWVSLTDCANAGVYCSVCHKKVYKEDYAWCNRKNKLRSDYCPHCGAKMMPHPPKGE